MWKEKLEEEACNILTQSNKIDFQLNPESGGFTKIISNLHSWTDLYDPDITLEMNLKQPELIGYGISEEFLRFIIEEDFLPQLEKDIVRNLRFLTISFSEPKFFCLSS